MSGREIYHIVRREEWEKALAEGVYAPPSLASEGFIHASALEQVLRSAELHFAGRTGLALVCIDSVRLGQELRYEDRSGAGAAFPHIYGALNLDAVTRVVDLPSTPDGRFELPEQLAGQQVFVCASNYDGSSHWEHPATLLRAEDGFVQTQTAAGLSIGREGGVFVSPFDTRGHYWTDRWFNVIRLELPGEGLNGFYCNIATPLRFDGETVCYVDLQLDVRVFVDGDGRWTHRVLDEDEFETARRRYGYPADLVTGAWRAVDEVIALVEARRFPFEG